MDEYIKALRQRTSYDWICTHGYELSKGELCDIIKEFDYVVHNLYEEVLTDVADSLEEIYEEE